MGTLPGRLIGFLLRPLILCCPLGTRGLYTGEAFVSSPLSSPQSFFFFLYPEHLSPKLLLLDAVPSQEFMQFADLFHSRFQTVDEQTVKKKKKQPSTLGHLSHIVQACFPFWGVHKFCICCCLITKSCPIL